MHVLRRALERREGGRPAAVGLKAHTMALSEAPPGGVLTVNDLGLLVYWPPSMDECYQAPIPYVRFQVGSEAKHLRERDVRSPDGKAIASV
jgi:hypothetical protein